MPAPLSSSIVIARCDIPNCQDSCIPHSGALLRRGVDLSSVPGGHLRTSLDGFATPYREAWATCNH